MIMETIKADMWYGVMEGRRLQSRGQPWQGVLTVSAILSCQESAWSQPSVSRCGEVTPPPPLGAPLPWWQARVNTNNAPSSPQVKTASHSAAAEHEVPIIIRRAGLGAGSVMRNVISPTLARVRGSIQSDADDRTAVRYSNTMNRFDWNKMHLHQISISAYFFLVDIYIVCRLKISCVKKEDSILVPTFLRISRYKWMDGLFFRYSYVDIT